MQNGKSDKWFERIILVFSYFFLFILYSIDLYVVFYKNKRVILVKKILFIFWLKNTKRIILLT